MIAIDAIRQFSQLIAEEAQTLEIWRHAWAVFSVLAPFATTDPNQSLDAFLTRIIRIISADLSACNIVEVVACLDLFKERIPEGSIPIRHIAPRFVSILAHFLPSENCVQRSGALSALVRYGADSLIAHAIGRFFSEHDNYIILLRLIEEMLEAE
jgi:hypothetical protein